MAKDTTQQDNNNINDVNQSVEQKNEGALAMLAARIPFLPPKYQILMPGLLLTAIISFLALRTGDNFTYITPLVAAMGIGMLIRNAFILPQEYKPGILFSLKPVLRFAVALLGVRITFNQILGLGWEGIIIAIIPLILTLLIAIWLGRLLKISSGITMLIGTGTAICGASAILTAGTTMKSKDEDIIIAISSITAFGTLSMIVYPLLLSYNILPINEIQYGYWAGSSIHEVAQVVTAAFAGGPKAGEIGIMVKLTRVVALIPVAFILSYFVNRGSFGHKASSDSKSNVAFPVYLLGFVLMVILNSYGFFSESGKKWIELFDMFLLTMAMAAMGLEVDIKRLVKVGFRPLILGIIITLFISVTSFILVILLIK
ncbi:MAG: YeiH family protein [Spirochaetota bacterium]|nr:YeiH family protein [Spirochaetota bacterium]